MFTDLSLVTTSWAYNLLSNRQLHHAINQPTDISSDLSPDYFQVNGLWTDGFPRIAQSNRIVWCWRREGGGGDPWVLRDAGILMSPEDQGDPDVPLSHFTAYDPRILLQARPATDEDGNLPGPEGFKATGPGNEIALQFLKNTILNEGGVYIDAGPSWGGTASYAGTIETTDDIVITSQQGGVVSDVWDALNQAGNCDMILRPIYDPTRTITVGSDTFYYTHELSIYRAPMGQDRPACLMSWDKLNRSVSHVDRMHDGTPGSFFNKVQYYAGQDGTPIPLLGPLVNGLSVEEFGSYWATQGFPAQLSDDPTTSAVLAFANMSLELAKQGRRTFTVTPITGRAKTALRDYEVGDAVPVHASKKIRVTADGYMRVQEFTIHPGDDGPETVEPLVLSPDFIPFAT